MPFRIIEHTDPEPDEPEPELESDFVADESDPDFPESDFAESEVLFESELPESEPEPFSLDFEPPDAEAFRCLALARQAGGAGGTAPCILNAANEVAVAAFLGGTLHFLGIPDIVEAVLAELPPEPVVDIPTLVARDGAARENPPLRWSVHCMGVRTARRPSMSRFSPMPISSP